MRRFCYRALDAQQTLHSGSLRADNASAAYNILRQRSWMVLALRRDYFSLTQNSWTDESLRDFCGHLHDLLEAGIPLDEALNEQETTQSIPTQNLSNALATGHTLAQALSLAGEGCDARWIRLIAAGERSGRLPETLKQLEEHLRWQLELKQLTQNALIYPLFSALSVFAAVGFLLFYLAPQLRVLLPPKDLPLSSQLLFWLTDGLRDHGLLICSLTLLSAGLLNLAYRHHPPFRHRLDALRFSLPLLGQPALQEMLARYSRTLALLYQHGVPILDAMSDSRALINNAALSHRLAQVEQQVALGKTLPDAFAMQPTDPWPTPTLPKTFLRLLAQSHRTGNLAAALEQAARLLQNQYRHSTQGLQALLQPSITLGSGLLLAWVALALLGPLYGQMTALPGGLR